MSFLLSKLSPWSKIGIFQVSPHESSFMHSSRVINWGLSDPFGVSCYLLGTGTPWNPPSCELKNMTRNQNFVPRLVLWQMFCLGVRVPRWDSRKGFFPELHGALAVFQMEDITPICWIPLSKLTSI